VLLESLRSIVHAGLTSDSSPDLWKEVSGKKMLNIDSFLENTFPSMDGASS
jgi:hypothetical protein